MLCIGTNGHVVLETAFHERCDHQAQSQQEDVHHLAQEVSSHVVSPHHQPCVDIPISMGLTDDQLFPNHVRFDSITPTHCLELGSIPYNSSISIATPYRSYAAEPHFALLSKVVLQV